MYSEVNTPTSDFSKKSRFSVGSMSRFTPVQLFHWVNVSWSVIQCSHSRMITVDDANMLKEIFDKNEYEAERGLTLHLVVI